MSTDNPTYVTGKLKLNSSHYEFTDFHNVVEHIINKMSDYPDKWSHLEYSFVLHLNDTDDDDAYSHEWQDYDIYPGSEKWSPMPKNILGTKTRKCQRLLMYNINTKFWIVLYNHNTPKELVEFMKVNHTMFTHVMSFSYGQLNDHYIRNSLSRIEISSAQKEIRVNIATIQSLMTEDIS